MARSCSGILIRQLLGNSSKLCAGASGPLYHHHLRHHHLEQLRYSCNQTLTRTSIERTAPSPPPPPPPHKPNRFRYSLPKLPGPSNLEVIESVREYYKRLKKVEDERFPAVFFFNAVRCRRSFKWIKPIFFELCEQYAHVKIYRILLPKYGCHTITLHQLDIHHSPTFRFYVNGEMADELKSASAIRLKKTLADIYNPSGVSKRRAISQAKKDENDKGVDELSEKDDGAVEVAESRFPATSIPKVMEAVESLPEVAPNSNLWWFAKGLFSSQEKREMFSKVDDPGCKLQFLMNEKSRA